MNPITLSNLVEERYRRYLKTTFYFKDPELRASFEEALRSGHLSKGPFLEATPVFKRAQSPRDLFQTLLAYQPSSEFLDALNGDRPLYQHQEQAIRKVFQGTNVVVATGTGSGKTEAFLYPILLHLYQEFKASELCPGVRALVLYPMNALANDQRERLGEICERLREVNSPFQFTFGQYTGETPENEDDSRRQAHDHLDKRLPGELVLRSEMRNTPPHILLTNYSMLEYLLLRPDDSPLFDNGRARWWTFLVLDEAHQYRGSRGIEMAMLLRRFKRRLREGGRSKPFRCIATSATLVGGDEDKRAVSEFASDLFGEEFSERDVILGETEPTPEPGPNQLTAEDYRLLTMILSEANADIKSRLSHLASKLDVTFPANEESSKAIGRLLQSDKRAASLRRLITGRPIEVMEIATQIFYDLPDNERVSALSDLVELLLQAKEPESDAPLLSARYHLFLRSLEGAFVSYWPAKRVFLDRKAADGERVAFETALCRECGQHYFVGSNSKGGKLVEPIRDTSHSGFGATFFRPLDNGTDEDDDGNEASSKRVLHLCVQCGELRQSSLKCGHIKSIIKVVKEDPPDDEERRDQMARCGACGYNAAGHDPVREVVYGTDGPNAVIATTLYQNLPDQRKKVLAFADGRQEAAFFAWYLEDSYKSIRGRNLLLKVAQRLSPYTSEGLSLRELATGLRDIYRERKVFSPTMGDLELRRAGWLDVYREFLTDEPRISLEGVGLVKWYVKWPEWLRIPEALTSPPWSLTQQEAQAIMFVLLDSMRTDGAIELQTEDGVSLSWSDLNLRMPQMRVRIGSPRGQKGVQSWDGTRGNRASYLAKFLVRKGASEQEAIEQAVAALRKVWDALRQSDENAPSSHDRLLLPVEDGWRLNPDWWRLRPIKDGNAIFQCYTCGRHHTVSVGAVCPRYHCPGTLRQVQQRDLEPNHYRILYEENLPGALRVEEHTAQLDHDKAREFQRDFRRGNIHILSCSTTFELGVDLGDLDTIFLRNVPPEAFNYAQRVGRAGRRSGHAGFAITYCRRGPHDLYHFSEPQRMLSGRVRPPILSIGNEKIILRHLAATALSAFFRAFPERFKSVEALFKDLTNPSGASDFKTFIYKYQGELERALHDIVPSDSLARVGLIDGRWIERVAGNVGATGMEEESRFSLAEAEVSSDYKNVLTVEEESRGRRDYKAADWAQRRARTMAEEDVLSFLSRKAVIPKYGFPVDVVELDPQRVQQNREAFEVLLQRDLSIAISEFAPTSTLVANKKLWTSYGLKKVAEKEWPRKLYKRCPRHNVFYQWEKGQAEPAMPCGDSLKAFEYVIPHFGFLTNRDKPKEPTSRPPRVFTTRPYFAGPLGPDPGTLDIPLDSPLLTMRKASPGLMAVLCEGRRGEGFYLCGECGAGLRKREGTHKTPYGQACHGTLEQVSLGHEYVTDILQLQFHLEPTRDMEPVWFAYSLAYALVEGAAEVLDVPSTDLSATVAYGLEEHSIPPIVLYDNVPGGAGLVARLEAEQLFKACLEAAAKRVCGNCGCGENTSCYGCLRSYRNQFAHQHLQRGAAMRYLGAVLEEWR